MASTMLVIYYMLNRHIRLRRWCVISLFVVGAGHRSLSIHTERVQNLHF